MVSYYIYNYIWYRLKEHNISILPFIDIAITMKSTTVAGAPWAVFGAVRRRLQLVRLGFAPGAGAAQDPGRSTEAQGLRVVLPVVNHGETYMDVG